MLSKKTLTVLLQNQLTNLKTQKTLKNSHEKYAQPVTFFFKKETKTIPKTVQLLPTNNKTMTLATRHNWHLDYQKYQIKKKLSLYAKIKSPYTNILLKKKQGVKKYANKTFFKKKLIVAPLQCFTIKKNIVTIQHNLYKNTHAPLLDNQIADILHEFRFITLNRQAIKLVAACQMLLSFKNTASLAQFIKNVFQKVHYTKHIGYLPLLWYLVSFIIGPQLYTYNCLGVRVVLRGKIGVGGDSRKSTQKFSYGVTSSSSKYVKVHRSFTAIRTKTGAIGLSVTVAW